MVVEAIKALCLKFPTKYRGLMNFLSTVLREDGGFEYKKAIVDAILALIRDIPDAKEMGLAQGGVGWGGEGMRWVELQVGAGGGLGVEHAGTSHSHSRHLLMLHTALP